jgi:hypothetical protein
MFGRQNRWGKLPVTIYPASFAQESDDASFDMSLAPGRTYKYYTGAPLWPFAHGLSYTTFALDCALVAAAGGGGGGGGGNNHTVDCEVRNTGAVDGDEVVFVFHSAGEAVRAAIGGAHPVPKKALVGFERVRVAAGGAAKVRFALGAEALELVNAAGDRQLYPGGHQLTFSRGGGTDVAINVTVVAA